MRESVCKRVRGIEKKCVFLCVFVSLFLYMCERGVKCVMLVVCVCVLLGVCMCLSVCVCEEERGGGGGDSAKVSIDKSSLSKFALYQTT